MPFPYYVRMYNHLWHSEHGQDWLLRESFVEYLEQTDTSLGAYETVLQASLFPVRLAAKFAEFAWDDARDEVDSAADASLYAAGLVLEQVFKNFAVPDGSDEFGDAVYVFALADRDAVVAAVGNLTPKEQREIHSYDGTEKTFKTIASAISNPFTIEAQIKRYDVAFLQGYPDGKPRAGTLSTKSGKFYMTKNGLSEFGLSIPKQEWTVNDPADLTTNALTVESQIKTHDIVLTNDADTPTVCDGNAQAEESLDRRRPRETRLDRDPEAHTRADQLRSHHEH